MNLSDAKHEAEHRKQLLYKAIKGEAYIYLQNIERIVEAIDALIQARIKENYKESDPWNT